MDLEGLRKIWPQWQIVELIGQGAYGKVYKIKREEMGQISYAALKIIELPQDKAEVRELMNSGMDYQSVQYYYEDMVKNLQNEILVMETLKTANNIVSIEDYALEKQEEGIGWIIYIRMELLTNLNSYLEREGHDLPPEEVVKLGTDICRALSCCEQSYVIHRDIKPDNVFLNRYGDYKLGDFGIAKQMEMTKSVYSQKGTSMYMAPEVARGEHYDRTVDIYSLGIMLYKLLNHGRFPFMPPYPQRLRPSDAEEAMHKRMKGEKLPLPADAQGKLGQIILKACEHDPKLRYQNAQAFREALSACLTKDSIKQKSAETAGKEERTSQAADLEKTYGAWKTEPKKEESLTGSGEKEPQVSYRMKREQIRQDTLDVENENQQSVQRQQEEEPEQSHSNQQNESKTHGGELYVQYQKKLLSKKLKIFLAIHLLLLLWWCGKLLTVLQRAVGSTYPSVTYYFTAENPDPVSLLIALTGTVLICLGTLMVLQQNRFKKGGIFMLRGGCLMGTAVLTNAVLYIAVIANDYGRIINGIVLHKFRNPDYSAVLQGYKIAPWVICAIPYAVYLWWNIRKIRKICTEGQIQDSDTHGSLLQGILGYGATSKTYKKLLLGIETLLFVITICMNYSRTLFKGYYWMLILLICLILNLILLKKKTTTMLRGIVSVIGMFLILMELYGILSFHYLYSLGVSIVLLLESLAAGVFSYNVINFLRIIGMSISAFICLWNLAKILLLWPGKKRKLEV